MLIKKKILNSSYLLFIKSLFTKLLLGLGFIFLVIIISAGTYYSSSGIGNTYSAKSLFIIINNKILDPYLGVNLLKYNKYLDLTKIRVQNFIIYYNK